MSSQKTEIIKFQIRDELMDWFEKLINKKYGPDIHLHYPLDYPHFNVYTRVEISGGKSQLDDAAEFIRNTSDVLCYKMPWLSENTYYNWNKDRMGWAEQELNDILNENDTFGKSEYNLLGITILVYNFRTDVISTKKKEIDEIFKIIAQTEQEFIILPKSRVVQNQSFSTIPTTILTAFHGSFLKFLSLEDILSLEFANKTQDSCYDTDLDHDIQMYLQSNYPVLYDEEEYIYFNAQDFKISEVLRYFIQKYHHCISKCVNATVLTANEIQSLSQTYSFEVGWNKLIHIDFKATNESNFCVVYHSDAEGKSYYNYNTKFAIENHTITFNGDGSLDQSDQSTTEFTFIALTSQNNCSPQQTNFMLQWVTRHFRPRERYYNLVLRKFDLNEVSSQIVNGLINNKFKGEITFYKMNFDVETLSAVLQQSGNKKIVFQNCQISVENMNVISNISTTNAICFEGMDIELNVFNALKRCNRLVFSYCRLVSSKCKIPINKITCDLIIFKQNQFDTLTLLRLLNMLQGDIELQFKFCEITECDILSNMRYFAIRNPIYLKCISININVVFKIFEYCQFRNQIMFERCHFYFENHSSYTFSLKPVNFLIFSKINFDALTLITILATLHNESRVSLLDCTISPLGKNVDISNKIIQPSEILLYKCCLETSTLFSIEISKDTDFFIKSCDLLPSTWEEDIDVKFEPKMEMYIEFHDTPIVPRFVRSLLLTNGKLVFVNCEINFMEDQFSGIPIKCKSVLFVNNTFDFSKHLKSLADFASGSGLSFKKCHFESRCFSNSNVVMKPSIVVFSHTTFHPGNLFNILENISEQTEIGFKDCIFPAINWMSFERNFRIKHLHFTETIFEISTILCLLKNFLCLEDLKFSNCKIESNDMNCNNILSTVLVKLERLVFEDVCYSPNLLQILKYLNETCVVEYFGQLSSHAIIELSTKTNVNGNRLRLFPEFCTKTINFELFAEFVRPMAVNFEFDSEIEYDLPAHLLPYILNESQYDWSKIKLKFVLVNDFTIKLEFLRNGRIIDLFFESNDLNDECFIDYG